MNETKQQAQGAAKNERQPNGNGNRGALTLPRGGSRLLPSRPLHGLRAEFDRLFDDLLHGWQGWPAWNASSEEEEWGAAREIDVRERDDAVVVRADAPGFEPDDFDVEIRGDNLVLCACQSDESKLEDGGVRWSKREFYRSVPLPTEVEAGKIDAHYRNGVLTLTLPKTPRAKGRKIEVKS
jgi:HSP20 family protein